MAGNYPAGVTNMDEYFNLPSGHDGEAEFYGLRLDVYDRQIMNMEVFEGRYPLRLTLDEIKDMHRKYSERNPKGHYSIVGPFYASDVRRERMERDGVTEEDIAETSYPTHWPENR